MGPEGSLYVVNNQRIRSILRVRPNGFIETFAGGGGDGGDGVPALEAALRPLSGLALAPDGSLYFSQYHSVRVVSPDGLVHTVVSRSGVAGFAGDGGPAIDAQLDQPGRLALGSDGSLYLPDSRNSRIRKVSPDGIISTVAGGGTESGDGGLATQARLRRPISVAVSPNGMLYIADISGNRVRQVGLDGIITTLTAVSAPLDVTVAPDQSVMVTGRGGLIGGALAEFWRVSADGAITRLGGAGGWA